MDYRLNAQQAAFKHQFAEWLNQNLPRGFDASKPRNFKTDTEKDISRASIQKNA